MGLELNDDGAHKVARLCGRRGALALNVDSVVRRVGEHALQGALETVSVRIVPDVAATAESIQQCYVNVY